MRVWKIGNTYSLLVITQTVTKDTEITVEIPQEYVKRLIRRSSYTTLEYLVTTEILDHLSSLLLYS